MRQVIVDGARNARRRQCRHSDPASRSRATLFACCSRFHMADGLSIHLAPRIALRAGDGTKMADACKWPHVVAKPNE